MYSNLKEKLYIDNNWYYHDLIAWCDPINCIQYLETHIYISLLGLCSDNLEDLKW